MATGPITPDHDGNDERREARLLVEYDRAQEIAHHTDTIIYEVASIVWGANTLLIGFILEVRCASEIQVLVIVASFIGVLMTAFVPFVMDRIKPNQEIAFRTCREIEDEIPLPHRINNRIHDEYPKWKPGQKAIWFLTTCFVLAWIGIGVHAGLCLRNHAHDPDTIPLEVSNRAASLPNHPLVEWAAFQRKLL